MWIKDGLCFCDAFEPDLLGGRCNRRGTAWHNGDTVSAVFNFPEERPPEFIQYLGKVLPYAVIGLLVIYCLKDVPGSGTYGIPEFLAIVFIVLLHRWKKNILLSIGGGTVFYMLLVQFVFCK